MIIPLRIDPASFKDDLYELFPNQERRNHDDFLEIWERNGLLVYNGINIQQSYLYDNIKKLPTDLRKSWELALLNLPRIKNDKSNWDGIISKKNISIFSESNSIAIIQQDLALKEFEISENDYSKILLTEAGNCEILKFPFITRSEILKSSKDLYNSHIEIKEPFEKIWLERFHWLSAAENINHIAIVDRYALQNAFENTDKNEISGSERFVNLLNRSSTSKKYLRIFTSWGNGKNKEDYGDWFENIFITNLVKILKSQLGNQIREISLEILKNNDFIAENHDRHIRFDNYIWDIGKGLYCLHGSSCCKEKIAIAFKSGLNLAKEYKLKEEYLHNKNKRKGSHVLYKITSTGFQKQ
jgi:hypothetical protein